MARHKNVNWILPEGTPQPNGDKTHDRGDIQLALLMDIRDELMRMNDLLHCHNTLAIPHTLTRIDKRLAKHLPLKAK